MRDKKAYNTICILLGEIVVVFFTVRVDSAALKRKTITLSVRTINRL